MESKGNDPKPIVKRSHATFLHHYIVISRPVVRRSPPLTFRKILTKRMAETTRKERLIARAFGIFSSDSLLFLAHNSSICLWSRVPLATKTKSNRWNKETWSKRISLIYVFVIGLMRYKEHIT